MLMIIPVRCFTCNKVIAHKYEDYLKQREIASQDSTEAEATCKALDSIGLELYCCRRMFISHRDIIDEMLLYTTHLPDAPVTYHVNHCEYTTHSDDDCSSSSDHNDEECSQNNDTDSQDDEY